jgi:hypothetical protein
MTRPSEVRLRYVGELEELLRPGDYDAPDAGRLVRLRIRHAPEGGVELLADSPDPQLLDDLLGQLACDLGVKELEALLCG